MKHERSKEFSKALEVLGQIENEKDAIHSAKQVNEQAEINYQQVVEKEFDQLDEIIEQLENQNLENIARIQTMARRHAEEDMKSRKYGGAKLAEELLKPLDLLKKVLTTPVENSEVKNYLLGFEMIVKQLDQVLTENGIQMIETKVGDEFDPMIHNANEQVESDQAKSGQIVAVIANGYKMYDRVIVHTLVKVAK